MERMILTLTIEADPVTNDKIRAKLLKTAHKNLTDVTSNFINLDEPPAPTPVKKRWSFDCEL